MWTSFEVKGKKTGLFHQRKERVVKFHATVAFPIPYIFLLPSCLCALASPVAQTPRSFLSIGLMAAALHLCIALLKALKSPSLPHCHIICRKSYGYTKQGQFCFIGVLPVQRLEKLASFRNIPSICRHEVLGRHISRINIYFVNCVFSFLLSLRFEVACVAELYSDP